METEEKGACESRSVPLHIHAPQDLECGGSCRRVSSYKSSYFGNDLTLRGSLWGPLRPQAFIRGLLFEHIVG